MININSVTPVTSPNAVISLNDDSKKVDGNLFDSILGAAIDNIKETNVYLSSAENE